MGNFDIPRDKREFRCNHCNGRILIPHDLPPTTGPCPHCGGVITSPAVPTAPPAAFPVATLPQAMPAVPANPPVPAPAMPPQCDAPQPAPVSTSSAASAPPVMPPPGIQSAPPPRPVAAALPPKRTESEPPPRTGAAAIPPPKNKPAPPPESAAPVERPAARPSEAVPQRPPPDSAASAERRSSLLPVMLVLLLVILGAGAAVYFVAEEMGRNIAPPNAAAAAADPTVKEAHYLRVGWKKEAYQVLRDYMAATTASGKLPHILNGESMAQRLEDFYGGGVINDSDTPADAFSIYELSEEDRQRGLFMMIYDQPPQFEMKEFFRPLATLEVQWGLDEADMLLSTLARVGNFAMEPMRVHAFFKRTPAGLKLDWDVFVQTKYRTLQSFIELPEAGQSGVFRVFVVEDVPDKGRLEAGTRTYRIADPANTSDTARINVKVDSETGRALSLINWRGTKESRPITRTATMELAWTGEADAPQLEIRRFICWEFLGLGGQAPPSTASTH